MSSSLLSLFAKKAVVEYLSFNFDQGSLSSYTRVDSVPTVRITPKPHWNSKWLWFAVRSAQWAGKTPHFLIAKANRYAQPDTNENLAVWATSSTTDSWTQFANQSTGASDIEFYHSSPIPSGTIYVAYLPLRQFATVQADVAAWHAADARLVDTPSTAHFVISAMTPRLNRDGRTAPDLPIYGMKLTNANANTKNNVILTALNHPNETQGLHQLEGAMTWLLGKSVQAEQFLSWCNVYIYPCLNPQGVWGGYFRSCPEDPTQDHNRVWDVGGLEEVDVLKTAMAADTGGTIEIGIDFHGSTGDTGYMDIEDHTVGLYAVFLAKMLAYDATFYTVDETVATMLVYLWKHTYNAALSQVIERGAKVGQTVAGARTQGSQAFQILAAMLGEGRLTNGPAVGSRSFNGTTDRIDWTAISNLNAHALTISLWVNLKRADQWLDVRHSRCWQFGLRHYL